MRSAHDGTILPCRWREATLIARQHVIDFLRQKPGSSAPLWWSDMPFTARLDVKRHLQALGMIRIMSMGSQAEETIAQKARIQRDLTAHMRARGPSLVDRAETSLKAHRASKMVEDYRRAYGPGLLEKLYQAPNGGKRMLPTLYGRLKDFWIRGQGSAQHIERMNDGHLENTLKLLKESHGNVSARATDLLGRMALHYQNQPAIVEGLTILCEYMQKVEVDDMYPVWKALAEELERRRQTNDEIGFTTIDEPVDEDWLSKFEDLTGRDY